VALPLRSLTPAPPDPILGLTETFRADTRPDKVNLSVGVYVDDTGVTPVIPCVLEAERRLLQKAGSKGYLPIDGRPGYKKAVRDLIFGPDHEIVGERPIRHRPDARRDRRPACGRRLPAPDGILEVDLAQRADLAEPSPALLAGRIRAACLPVSRRVRAVRRRGQDARRAPVGNPGGRGPAPRLVPQPERRGPGRGNVGGHRRDRDRARADAGGRLRLPGLRLRPARGRRLAGGPGAARPRVPHLLELLQELRPVQRNAWAR